MDFKIKSITILLVCMLMAIESMPQEFVLSDFGKKIVYFPLIKVNIYRWEGTHFWKKYETELYEYDNNENLLSVTFQIWDDSVVNNKSQIKFIYDKNNNIIEAIAYIYDHPMWKKVSRSKYTYR